MLSCFSVQANKQQIKIKGGGLHAMENVCLMFLLNHDLIDYVNQYTLNQKKLSMEPENKEVSLWRYWI